ncbi:hypothetical protein CVT24_006695 [Panaeolus cyanescens]|uniref:Chromo domain-containing protein n=1 Tax=Panaeolus cyanescens TaxID=181874 RepID=A0A409WBW2_9AGAR|nr:hypothetical protein CVT24_006695 [Panaeolus cyanescens]
MKSSCYYATDLQDKRGLILPAFNDEERNKQIQDNLLFCEPNTTSLPAVEPNTTSEFSYANPTHPPQSSHLPSHLTPPDPISSTIGVYPSAPSYALIQDNRYHSGYAYTTPYEVNGSEMHRERLLAIQTPTACIPTLCEGKYIVTSIPGMVKLIPGIPFAIFLNGDNNRLQTVACLQTLESLSHFSDFSDIQSASIHLAQLTWGASDTQLPIYELKGLKKNDRSFIRESSVHLHDGSYSLGNTIMKGDGPGTVVPAVQSRVPETSSRIISVLHTLHKLHRLVLPKCISKFEYDICDFHADFTNIFSSGGLEPAATSVQMNVSSLGEDLASSIGEIQGKWHTDISDDPDRFTLFVLLLRVGPTGHPGVFCLARWGLYCAEIGAWIIFLVFKGVDMHSGFAPKEDGPAHKSFVTDAQLNAAYNMAGPANRVGYVMYSSQVATQRTGSLNATKPTGFGNVSSAHTSKAIGKQGHLDFGSHGPVSLGSFKDCANRLAREAVFDFYNSLMLSNLKLNIDLNYLLDNIHGWDENENEFAMSPMQYNPQNDSITIRRYMSYYKWYSMECKSIHIRITKEDLKARHGHLQSQETATASRASKPTVNLIAKSKNATTKPDAIPRSTRSSASRNTAAPSPVLESHQNANDTGSNTDLASILNRITKVVQCYQTDQEMIFCVLLEDTEDPIEVSSSTLPGVSQHPMILKYLSKHVRSEWQERRVDVDDSLENTSSVNGSNRVPRIPSSPIANTSVLDHLPSDDRPQSNTTQHPKTLATNSSLSEPTVIQLPEAQSDVQHRGTKRPIEQADISDSEYETDDENRTDDSEHDIEDIEFDVEDILEHAVTEENQLIFSVQWKGYDKPTWEPCQNLINSLETVLQYVAHHNLDFPSDLKSTSTNPRKRVKKTADDPQRDMLQLADNFQHLYNMLNPSHIRMSARQLEKEYEDYRHNQSFWKFASMSNTSNFVKILANSSRESIILDEYISILSTDNPLSASVLELNLINEAAKFLPQMKPFVHTSPFMQRAIRAEVCNAWIRSYQWHVVNGQKLSTELMALHGEHGYKTLSQKWPQFAQLVDHIVRFLADRFQNELSATTTVSAEISSKHLGDLQYIQSLCATVALDPIHTVPVNLYGIISNSPASKPISLLTFKTKPLKFSQRGNLASNFIYTMYGPQILFEVLTTAVICPAIERFDVFTRLKPSSRTSVSQKDISQRAVLRGALLHSLRKACGGNAIFFYDGIDDFLHSPTSVFPNSNGNTYNGSDKRMYLSLIQQNAQQTEQNLQPLFDAISAMVERYPEIGRYAATIKRITFQVINGLSCGHRISDDDIDLEDSDCRPKPKPKPPITLQMPTDLPTYRPNAEAIAPGGTDIGLGTLGLIVREALNHKRSGSIVCNEVHQVLIGSNPLQFSQNSNHNPSHTDPIRSFSEYAYLFNVHMPPSLLATRFGLSNILSYMGTGQGSGTKTFLNGVTTRKTKYFSDTLSQTTENYQTALSHNAAIFGATPNAGKLAGFIHCFDTRVWGQPSRSFSLAPEGNDKFRGVKAKFEPYWNESVQNKWVTFLGPMLDQNPLDWTGPKASWTDTYHLLVRLQIPGFQTGLTVFQCANNLALAGICQQPTTSELACWISKNRNLGAWRGLKTLGFHVDDKKGCALFAAFTTLYQHLDRNITDADKQDLGFGPMFLEHLLCKVSRYAHRWTGFVAHAKEREAEDAVLESGLESMFPFPLILTRDSIQNLLDTIQY